MAERLFQQLHVDWETVAVVLNNEPAIDLPRLSTPTEKHARRFLTNYGYDPDNSNHIGELVKLKEDALIFIEKHLLVNPNEPADVMEIPDFLYGENDIIRLMLNATNEEGALGNWSCSLLRVMHTLTHVNNDLGANFFPAIQKQVLDRVYRHIHHDPAGDVYLGHDETGIRLYMLDVKTQKSYDSLVLKLLHKSENVSADIFDRMGFRFVTYNKLEALQALNYLAAEVVAVANVRTGRSRNTLVSTGFYHYQLDKLAKKILHGEMDEASLLAEASSIADAPDAKPHVPKDKLREHNLYSSTEYMSIQFTCREMIRVMGPSISQVSEANQCELGEYQFFFPFEIQILDKDSYIESRRGRSSHAEYKRSQLNAARERIFPWLYENHHAK